MRKINKNWMCANMHWINRGEKHIRHSHISNFSTSSFWIPKFDMEMGEKNKMLKWIQYNMEGYRINCEKSSSSTSFGIWLTSMPVKRLKEIKLHEQDKKKYLLNQFPKSGTYEWNVPFDPSSYRSIAIRNLKTGEMFNFIASNFNKMISNLLQSKIKIFSTIASGIRHQHRHNEDRHIAWMWNNSCFFVFRFICCSSIYA